MNGAEMAKVTAIFLVVLMVLFGSSRIPYVCKMHHETRRKMLHIAGGIIAMGLPFLFNRATPVMALCGAAFIALIGLRFSSKRAYDTDRLSYGELCIPVAVAFLFTSAAGEAGSYYLPLLVFTFADSAAAIAGQRWPGTRICIFAGDKTLIGSISFFVIALVVNLGGLALFSEATPLESFAIASIIAFDLSLVEGLCAYGLDNFLVPAVGFLLVHNFSHSVASGLAVHLNIFAAVVALITVQISVNRLLAKWRKEGRDEPGPRSV